LRDDAIVLKKKEGEKYTEAIYVKLREKGQKFIGRHKVKKEDSSSKIVGTFEAEGVSGKWSFDDHTVEWSIGIVQKGGGRLIIDYGVGLYHGVVNGNSVIFQMGYENDDGKNEKATYTGSIRNSKTGLVISGTWYTENLDTGTFIAKQIPVEKKGEQDVVYDVMISYRSTDGKFIDLLQSTLQAAGITCWRDRRMEVGSNWSEDITRAVRSSRAQICCISDQYIKSSLCTKEIFMAYDMSKVIVPLVLPTTEPKEQGPLVRAAYPSPHPPHVVAREIARTTWLDLRPLSNGPDPTDEITFEKRYPIITHLKQQLNNVKKKGCLWDLDGTWNLNFTQDAQDNKKGVASFEAPLTLKHSKFVLDGDAILKVGKENFPVQVDGANLDCSYFTFSLKFPKNDVNPKDDAKEDEDPKDDEKEIIVKVMLGVDGKSFDGKYSALGVGDWCSETGYVTGKLAKEKKKDPKKDVKKAAKPAKK